MISLDFNTLLEACSPGGPSCLNARSELLPAGGPESAVAPAKFAPQRGTESIYAYERRFVDGTVRETVLIDSKQSQLNRAEAALVGALPRLTAASVHVSPAGAHPRTAAT